MQIIFNAISVKRNPNKNQHNYLASILFGDIAQLIDENRLYVPNHSEFPDLAQRKPNPNRIKQISNYILDNYQQGAIYFPPICLNVHPHPTYSNNQISFPYHALTMRLTDGQHRCFGIHQALKTLDETDRPARDRLAQLEIGVLIYSALPIEQERQAFRDQNLLVQRPSVSLAHYFDRRSPHVLIAKHLAETIPQFAENIEYIQNGLGTHNPKLLTLSTLVTALQFTFPHLKNPDNLENYYQWSTQYWQLIADSLTDNPWQPYSLDRRKQQRQKDLRVSAVFFQAIGMIGQDFYQQELEFDAIQTLIKQLNQLDWDKDNRFWLDKGVTQIGTKNKPIISNTRTTIKLCYQVLREQLDLIPQPAIN